MFGTSSPKRNPAPCGVGVARHASRAILSALLLAAAGPLTQPGEAAPLGTAFTYQGRLIDGGTAATGLYDLQFSLYDAANAGNAVGSALIQGSVPVTNGLFTVALDFGPGIFTGNAVWLALGVRPGASTGTFATLPVRQALTPTPNALFAASAASVTATGLAGAYGNAVTFNNPGNSFSGSGGGLTGLNASQLSSGTVPSAALGNAWQLGGNSGTTPGTQFLGTSDYQALELKVNGDRALRLEPSGISPNVIGGCKGNYVAPFIYGATISGGGRPGETNSIFDRCAVIGGGSANTIQSGAAWSTIGGGSANTISANNSLQIGYGTIGGGSANTISITGEFGTIGGGRHNTLSGDSGVVAGGQGNTASGDQAVVAGGIFNLAGGLQSAVGGGGGNVATNDFATVPGGQYNSAGGQYSLAAGRQAKAIHQGAFVWADSQAADFPSTGADQFLIRAHGGVGINTNNPNGMSLSVLGQTTTSGNQTGGWPSPVALIANTSTDANASPALRVQATGNTPDGALNVSANGTGLIARFGNHLNFVADITTNGTIDAVAFNTTSDRNAKQHFEAVNPRDVLEKVSALPISTWAFKQDTATRHLGPMAQDFYSAFNVGTDDKHIATVDEGGVALAAIQGLNQKLVEELRRRDVENAELKQRLERLEQALRNRPGNSD